MGNNDSRAQRVAYIAERYSNNIQRTKTWKNAFNSAFNDALGGRQPDQWNRAEATARGYGRADGVQVSRRIYMGLNKG